MLRTALALLTGGLIGKLLGIVRELILAAAYGTGAIASGYRLAQTVVLVPVNFLTADLLNAAVIPLQKQRALEGEEEEIKFVWTLIFGFLVLGIFLSLGVFSLSGYIVDKFGPSASVEIKSHAVLFVKVLSFSIPLYMLGGVLSYIELGRNGVKLSSSRATFQNVGLILSSAIAYHFDRPSWLAWGFVFAYIAFFFWGMIRLRSLGLLKAVSIEFKDVTRAGWDIWKILRPFCWLPFFLQGNAVVERIVASRLGGGAIAAVDYARLIADTGNILLTVPISMAVLTGLAGKSHAYGAEQLRKIIPILSILTVPASVFIYIYAVPIIEVMYKHGAFNEDSVRVTSAILAPMGLGFFLQSFGYIFQKALNAQIRNNRIIVFMAISYGISILTNYFGYKTFGFAILGYAVITFGAVNALLGAATLGLKVADFRVTGWLIAGGLGYCLGMRFFVVFHGLKGLLLGLGVSAIYWIVWMSLVPDLRRTMIAGIKGIKKR